MSGIGEKFPTGNVGICKNCGDPGTEYTVQGGSSAGGVSLRITVWWHDGRGIYCDKPGIPRFSEFEGDSVE